MGFRRIFLTGLIIVLPVLVTIWVIKLFFDMIDGSVTPVIFQVVRLFVDGAVLEYAWVHFIAPITSVVMSVGVIYAVGLLGGNVFGRQLLKGVEGLLLKVPVVRGIYSTTRQLIDTFSSSDDKKFSGVVLIEFPRQGAYTIAFLTSESHSEVQRRSRKPDLVAVFVPTSPNPTGGYVLFVPKSSLVVLDMSVDEAFKLVISGGVLTPEVTGVHEAKAMAGLTTQQPV